MSPVPASHRMLSTIPRRRQFAFRVAHGALLFLLCIVLAQAPATSYAASGRVQPHLQNTAAAHPNQRYRVIIMRDKSDRTAEGILKNLGGTKIRDMSIDAFVATLPGQAIEQLAQHFSVRRIYYDAPMHKAGTVEAGQLATNYPKVVRAAELWPQYTGAGVGVAVIDTGLDAERADWYNAAAESRVVAQARFNLNTASVTDGHGHGTIVAGIIAGNSWHATNPAVRGKYIGVAPEANLINVKVADDTGSTYISDVVDAIEWVIANRQTYNIRVINLSLVSSVAESYHTSILNAAVEKAWFSGILVVVAAGNSGADSMYYPPANDPFVVTVGASDIVGTEVRNDDLLAPWSSYGNTQDGFGKPDVVAPGRYIVAPMPAGGSVLGTKFPGRVVDGSYIWMSGTSMAAPVVAGIAALTFQAHPEWTNDQLKWLLLHTSVALDGVVAAGQGAGQADTLALTGYGAMPSLANQGLLASDLLVGPADSTVYIYQTTANWSTANWSTANWSTANWSTANWSTANWSTANWSTANWSAAEETTVQ